MATSAFKSTTKRASVNGAEPSTRRSRSLSRFSHSTAAPPPPPREKKFVNTDRGSSSTAPYQEISLDDLALEFFSSSSLNENESDGERRTGRPATRRSGGGGAIGRWASDTASSNSRRQRSVSRSRGNAPEGKNVISANAAAASRQHRRRSLSVARYHHISDSESEVDLSRSSNNRANVKAPVGANGRISLGPNTTTSSNRQLGRSRSHANLPLLHDGYSSQSSALTDEESKDKNGFEKIIQTVYARNKAEHPAEGVANGGLYEEMRKELKYAVQEIRTEINQAMGRNHIAITSGGGSLSGNSKTLREFSGTRNGHAAKLDQLEKRKKDLLTERMLKDQRGREFSTSIRERHDSSSSSVVERPSRARKRSTDRNGMSKRLTEEAERYFEDFISNVEDTDISSFDGERSDGSSTVGGTSKAKYCVTREAKTYKSPTVSTSDPVEIDDVALPWLQWDTSDDSCLSSKSKAQIPVSPKALTWNTEKDFALFQDPSSYSASSYGSWTSDVLNSPMVKKEDTGKDTRANSESSNFDIEEYLRFQKNEELLFETYHERNRIDLGGLLLCTGPLY